MNTSDSRSADMDSEESILDEEFHGCALAAFVEQAHTARAWPCPDATRRRANQLYEQALASTPKHHRSRPE